ncbi:MAG TPA: TIGR00725 family protein [Methanoregulaceae archaeon]|nr:TIGR00725 family protein [Methanoregulaceae archaeon]HPD74496.1 TIGR00725 family protein [Methanoregulaceae archaeon]HRY75578.1 TIGR00725 family protein [Methanoregulaceae archaeon]
MQIAVIGAGSCSDEEREAAYTIGKILAQNNAVLICGGLGGVMEAACKGAQEHGGTTVGILPDTGNGNAFLDLVIRTGMGHARNVIVVQSAEAVIAVGGKQGTLSEIAHALKTGRPVFSFRSWEIEGVVDCPTAEAAAIRALAAAGGNDHVEPGWEPVDR